MNFWDSIAHNWADIISKPGASALIILNLILIESLLSIDNAAVLATMVRVLPKEQQSKALKYGIWGAYVFRGLALIFASVLIKIWWLKPIGGLYLLYIAIKFFITKHSAVDDAEAESAEVQKSWLYKNTVGLLGIFWSTILMVEVMDMAFSIDNVFAVVAFTPNLLLIIIGVFIGILAMRFVAQAFVQLMHKHPQLETAAFVVIAILGLKLVLSVVSYWLPDSAFTKVLDSHTTEVVLSIFTVLIFAVPLLLRSKNK